VFGLSSIWLRHPCLLRRIDSNSSVLPAKQALCILAIVILFEFSFIFILPSVRKDEVEAAYSTSSGVKFFVSYKWYVLTTEPFYRSNGGGDGDGVSDTDLKYEGGD